MIKQNPIIVRFLKSNLKSDSLKSCLTWFSQSSRIKLYTCHFQDTFEEKTHVEYF